MKNLFFLFVVIGFSFVACRNDEVPEQKIDQILQLYIDSAGQDMLNSNIAGGYSIVTMNDVNGLTDTAPVNFILRKDSDTLKYIEYVAGARRIGIDSTGNSKTYESRIALLLNKNINDSTNVAVNDTMVIRYTSTPELFALAQVWYNNVLLFTKTDQTLNIVKVKK